jgi:hypothetical protein
LPALSYPDHQLKIRNGFWVVIGSLGEGWNNFIGKMFAPSKIPAQAELGRGTLEELMHQKKADRNDPLEAESW